MLNRQVQRSSLEVSVKDVNVVLLPMKLQNCRRPSFSRPERLEGKAGGDDSP